MLPSLPSRLLVLVLASILATCAKGTNPKVDNDDGDFTVPCTGDSKTFKCRDGTCVPTGQQNNGRRNCPDDSDEKRKEEDCTGKHECRNGQCVEAGSRCSEDKSIQCRDSSDEEDCGEGPCDDDEFWCRDETNKCIDAKTERCDPEKVKHCPNGRDEEGCELKPCPNATDLRCDNGECVKKKDQCDGKVRNCPNGEDEVPAVCPKGATPAPPPPGSGTGKGGCAISQWTCPEGGCIPLLWVCDDATKPDCKTSGADEKDCPTYPTTASCTSPRFECPDKTRIPAEMRCDGMYIDCLPWGEDEMGCPGTPSGCFSGEWKCENGKCINAKFRCDKDPNPTDGLGIDDCGDGSDQKDCSEPVPPIGPDAGGCNPTTEFECYLSGFKCISKSNTCNHKADCYWGEDESAAAGCTDGCAGKAICDDGSCIEVSKVCDCVKDCPAGEEEDGCSFFCKNGVGCIPIENRCDGYDTECADASDEYDCP